MRSAIRRRPFLPLFVAPAALVALAIVAAMAAHPPLQLHAYVPGSSTSAGSTLENFADLGRPIVCGPCATTVVICFETALITLVVGYPVAYALVRTRSVLLKSVILVTAVTPLFLGDGGADLPPGRWCSEYRIPHATCARSG